MDRKTNNIVRAIKHNASDIADLKDTQFSGSDTTNLYLLENNNTYDESFTLANNERRNFGCQAIIQFDASAGYYVYTQVLTQVFVGNTSSPYNGNDINIFVAQDFSEYGVGYHTVQIVNRSGSNKTVFVKFYAITTGTGGLLITYNSAV